VRVMAFWRSTDVCAYNVNAAVHLCVCQMKLISYAHCNRDVRLAWHEAATAKQKEQLQQQQQQYTTHGNHDSKHSGSSSSKASPPRIRYDVSIMFLKEIYANNVIQSTFLSCRPYYLDLLHSAAL
jgi:hypothetical protein